MYELTPIVQLPADPADAVQALYEVVQQQQLALEEIRASIYVVHHVAPSRPREGMLRVADGTNWNPGAGAGIYQYLGGVWSKL